MDNTTANANTKAEMTPIVALRKFFGQKEGQTLVGFMDEMKQLSEEEKISLARLACVELGTTLKLEEKK